MYYKWCQIKEWIQRSRPFFFCLCCSSAVILVCDQGGAFKPLPPPDFLNQGGVCSHGSSYGAPVSHSKQAHLATNEPQLTAISLCLKEFKIK